MWKVGHETKNYNLRNFRFFPTLLDTPVCDAECGHVSVDAVGDDAVEDLVPAQLRRGLARMD